MRLGRREENSERRLSSEDRLKAATAALERERQRYSQTVFASRKPVVEAHAAHDTRVAATKEALDNSREPVKIMGGGLLNRLGATLYEDRVVVKSQTFLLSPQTLAKVDTAGNLMTTQRYTLTRAVLLGGFSAFAPKKERDDKRELYLLIEDPDWAKVVKCSPDVGKAAREMAQKIELAARSVEQTREAKTRRIEAAKQRYDQTLRDDELVREQQEKLIEAMLATEGVTTAVHAVKELLPAAGNSKAAQRAADAVASMQQYLQEKESEVAEMRASQASLDAGSTDAEYESKTENDEASGGGGRLAYVTAIAEDSMFSSTQSPRALARMADELRDDEEITWMHTGSLMRKKLGVSAARPARIAVTTGNRLVVTTKDATETFDLQREVTTAIPKGGKKAVLHLSDGSQREIVVMQGGARELCDAITGIGEPRPEAGSVSVDATEKPESEAERVADESASVGSEREEILLTLKQLAELHESGILSDEEFQTKKTELLARL